MQVLCVQHTSTLINLIPIQNVEKEWPVACAVVAFKWNTTSSILKRWPIGFEPRNNLLIKQILYTNPFVTWRKKSLVLFFLGRHACNLSLSLTYTRTHTPTLPSFRQLSLAHASMHSYASVLPPTLFPHNVLINEYFFNEVFNEYLSVGIDYNYNRVCWENFFEGAMIEISDSRQE